MTAWLVIEGKPPWWNCPHIRVPSSAKTRRTRCINYRHGIEQDHRRVKKLVNPGLGFGSFNSARRTLKGYEAMAMIRKGQIQGRTM